MLVSFSVENFLSFSDEQNIVLLADNYSFNREQVLSNGHYDDILKTIMVFGPNGSGKTNLILAFHYVLELMKLWDNGYDHHIRNKDLKKLNGPVYCLNNDSEDHISRFKLIFTFADHEVEYSIEFDSSDKHVVSERISYAGNGEDHDEVIRDGDRVTFVETKQECSTKHSHKTTLTLDGPDFQSRLLTSYVEPVGPQQLDVILKSIRVSLQGVVIGTYGYDDDTEKGVTENRYHCNESSISDLKGHLQEVTNISDVVVTKLFKNTESFRGYSVEDDLLYLGDDVLKIQFVQPQSDRLRSYCELSAGTKRIISILLMLYSVDYNYNYVQYDEDSEYGNSVIEQRQKLLIIDEMCYSLHPAAAVKLMNVMESYVINGKKDLQIVLTVHDTEFMSFNMLRPDGLYVIDNADGSSKVVSLSNFTGIDEWTDDQSYLFNSLKEGYLEGRFGGIPRIYN